MTTAAGDPEKCKLEGDEELAGMSLTTCEDDGSVGESGESTSSELIDPAIVVRGNVVPPPKFTYTRERLIEISDLPLSKRRPKFLDSSSNDGLIGIWILEKSHLDRKRPDTPNDERNDTITDTHIKRRSGGDPRERIRKEQDGIVLSPQRRSFNLGCQTPLSSNSSSSRVGAGSGAGVRSESPLGGKPDLMHRPEIGTRRIGSGRIITRDVSWDYKGDGETQEYNFRPGGGSSSGSGVMSRRSDPIDREDRFERRSFGRDYERERSERERDKDQIRHVTRNGDRGSRYSTERRRQFSEEDEPEWFSGGPTSQMDTIELRGFDDIPEDRSSTRQRQKITLSQPSKKKSSISTSKETNNNQPNSIKEAERKLSLSSDTSSGTSKSTTNKNKDDNNSNNKGPTGRSTPKPDQSSVTEPDHSPVQETTTSDNKKRVSTGEEKLSQMIITNSTTEQGLFNKDLGDMELDGDEITNIKSIKKLDDSGGNKTAVENTKIIDEQPDILEDFLKMDSTFVGFLPNSSETEETSGGSRFQRWFTRESPKHETRSSSLQDEIINNMLKDITETNIMIPHLNESDTYFAPISPAASSQSGTLSSNTAPIGPPSTHHQQHHAQHMNSTTAHAIDKTTSNLLELLRVGKIKSSSSSSMLTSNLGLALGGLSGNNSNTDLPIKNLNDLSGKVLSLEEIEANIRRAAAEKVHNNIGTSSVSNTSTSQSSSHSVGSMHSKNDEDRAAFKRFLAQVSGGHAVPATNGPLQSKSQPMTLLQMLSKSQQDDSAALRNNCQQSHVPMNPPQIPSELVVKLHQVQQQQRQEMMNKMLQANMGIANHRSYQASPLPSEIINSLPSAANLELLQRPEAQAIIQGLKRGDITPQHLRQQLANPAIQPRHRDMILSVLKLHTTGTAGSLGGGGHQPTSTAIPPTSMTQPNPSQSSIIHHPSPRAMSPGGGPPPHPDLLQQIMFQQQQQQLRVSPLPPNAIPQRIPSPRELQQHTQNIMQQALIKKKLEEQREKFRKNQESLQQRSMSPASAGGNSNQNTGHGTSPAKHLSPTPHSFTPTSVLRKMTATKEQDSISSNLSALKDKANQLCNNNPSSSSVSNSSNVGNIKTLAGNMIQSNIIGNSNNTQSNIGGAQQGRAVTGIRQPNNTLSQQQQPPPNLSQINWNQQQSQPIKQGRPILKGNNYQQQYSTNMDYHSRNLSQHMQPSNHVNNVGSNLNLMFAQMQQQQQQQNQAQSRGNSAMLNNGMINNSGSAGGGNNYLSQNMRNTSNNSLNSANRPHPLQLQFNQLQQRGVHPTLQQLIQMQQGQQNYENRGIPITGRNANALQFNNRGSPLTDHHHGMGIGPGGTNTGGASLGGGDLSPTSDQLARWFSPELLAQARAGKLPDMPPVSIAQSARSLEELERIQQAAAAVHN